MKFIKKNICKILIALSLCLTLVLALTFTPKTFAQVEDNNGYEILPNGIQSKNLFNTKNIVSTRAQSGCSYQFTTSGYNFYGISGNDPYLYQTFSGFPTNQEITITFYSNANLQVVTFNDIRGQENTSIKTTLTNGSIEIGIEFETGYTSCYVNIMVSYGSTQLDFFPYGTYSGNNNYDWNEDIVKENEALMKNSTTALYNALNGAYAELIGYNGTILASGNCKLEENTRRFDIGNLPNSFSDYYHNYDSEDEEYYTRPDIKIYLNYTVTNSLLFSFTDTQLDRTITLQNSNNTNSVTASNGGNENMIDPYTLIINKENIGYDIIYYDGIYIPDYWNINFNISFDAYTYSQGYTKGVESQQTKINIAEGNTAYYKRLYEQTNANYEELLERYNQINDNNSLYGMIVAIADTPINIFKQIFNFDILGINISGVVFGLISLLVIIWLIKKLI